jgi:hypothetical protein
MSAARNTRRFWLFAAECGQPLRRFTRDQRPRPARTNAVFSGIPVNPRARSMRLSIFAVVFAGV